MTAPVFIAEPGTLAADRVVLDGAEGRHAATVRRLRPGERVDLTDGAGLLAEGVVADADRATLTVEVRARRAVPAPTPRLVVVQALPKGDRGELAVETMTETGVDEVVPWSADRCVTRWKADRRDKALARWRATAREAAKQARRAWLPEIADLATTKDVVSRIANADQALILHESAKERIAETRPATTGEIILVVGPEGGITDDELEAFTQAGAQPTLLGPTVLRTSTAGVAALSVLSAKTGRW
ncbi:16S rRNA (uracil(1498)-N(3))-methyltransferase [Actinomadura atramentaria]|uniref:16S rRNA (uracil(1498)-N(3))-methyltransferase n=1 Tax=Actinomadura atramentaria TaxID=1990 RepID=UPI0003646465|nr:16S rRNA (uracil(1498)-N(3))-methyltransferase [Actinomadura atramentaria]